MLRLARFETDGLDSILDEMKREGELTGEIADRMLLAGAEVVKEAWRESARRHNHKDTGDLIESIGYPRAPKTAGDIRTIDIYPQGRDRKGVRNAEKAFILNYGTKRRPGSHWIDDADRACGEAVVATMAEIWNQKGD